MIQFLELYFKRQQPLGRVFIASLFVKSTWNNFGKMAKLFRGKNLIGKGVFKQKQNV